MPSSHLIFCHPPLLLPPIPPSIRVFSNESTLRCSSLQEFLFPKFNIKKSPSSVPCKSRKLGQFLTPYTKNKLNVFTIKLREKNIGETFSDTCHTNNFLGQSPKAIKNKQIRPNQAYKLLHSKGNHKQNEKTTYRMGEKYLQMMRSTSV